jgi:pimeloyl-ACP methyl ester carboxylesterase
LPVAFAQPLTARVFFGAVYCGYIGGSGDEYGLGIAVDGAGNAYVVGNTDSDGMSFPVTVGPDLTYNGGGDAFVAKVGAESGPPTYTISGHVRDSNDNPISDVTVSAGAGGSAATNASGTYTLTGLITGTYTLTPTKAGYTFTPATRTVSVPPDATGQDFTGVGSAPIILIHGWQGLGIEARSCSEGVGRLGDPDVVNTFGDMAQWFVDTGYDVWIAHLDTGPQYTPPIEENAQCLKNQIAYVREHTGQQVILVGHSMGGLVSRACLNLDDCRENVKALYTLGSPHAGSDGLSVLLRALFPGITNVCVQQPAFCQFSSIYMAWFNLLNPNRDLDYYFIGGDGKDAILYRLLLLLDGPNDGAVGSYSAVGWLYPTGWNVVQGPEAGRYWTDETHTEAVGHPSYFEGSGGGESQAFRCIAWLLGQRSWADCAQTTSLALNAAQAEPTLSATTVTLSGQLASGQSTSHTLQIDTGDHSLFYLSWLTGTLSFTLTQPGGQVITPAYAVAHPDVVTYTAGLGDATTPPFAAYAFTSTLPGLYTMTIQAETVGSAGADYLAFAALETTRTFSAVASASLYQVGQTALFTAALQAPAGGITGATVQAVLVRSDGVTETLLFDDAGAGVYSASWTVPDAPGYLQATFTAIGDDNGAAFTRQVDQLAAIAPHAAQLTGSYADRLEDENGDGFADTLALEVGVTATQVGTYTLSADLVAAEQTIAHATHYITVAGGMQTITLQFDGQDIYPSRANGPYTVTHVSLIDLEAGGIPAQIADDVWVTAAYKWWDFGPYDVYLPLVLRNP